MTAPNQPGAALAQAIRDREARSRSNRNAARNRAAERAWVSGSEHTAEEHESIQRRLKVQCARRHPDWGINA